MGGRVISWPGQSQPYYWLPVSTGEVLRTRAGAAERFMTALAKSFMAFSRGKWQEMEGNGTVLGFFCPGALAIIVSTPKAVSAQDMDFI
jgi:hypothetical protein